MAAVTCEAEFVALTDTAKKLMFLTLLLKYIRIGVNNPLIYCDNNSAINLANNPINHRNSNLLYIKTHFVRNLVNLGFVLDRLDTQANDADMMTQALALPLQQLLLSVATMINVTTLMLRLTVLLCSYVFVCSEYMLIILIFSYWSTYSWSTYLFLFGYFSRYSYYSL